MSNPALTKIRMPAGVKSFFSRSLHYLPGLVVLFFSMLALHSSVAIIDEYNMLKGRHVSLIQTLPPGWLPDDLAYEERAGILKDIRVEERWLYWAVIVMGLTSFILILLNGDKLNKLEQASREKREYLQLLESRLAAIEASHDGIGIMDREGRLVYMNPALIRLHGIPEDRVREFLGHSWTAFYPEKGRQIISEIVQPALAKSRSWSGESPIRRLDGEVIEAELSLTLLPDGGMIGTARDITARKKSEEEKKALEQQFFQAQKMEAIGRLAGGIAHDFNNVLAAINGYAEFLVEDLGEKTPERGFAVNILQAGRQARAIVDQILAFSRQKQSTKDVMDMMTPVNESLAMLNATLPKTIEVGTFLGAENTHIDGNATQISQVLMNLCVNAHDAIEETRDAHGRILLITRNMTAEEADLPEALREDLPEPDVTPPTVVESLGKDRTRLLVGGLARGHDYICLTVQDTGTGISRDIMEHIIEPFFTTKAVNKGTGLGLATVHGVIVAHRGLMAIDSTVGEGTRFDLYFPLSQKVEKAAAWVDTGGFEDGGGRRILIVEDQANVRSMLEEMLDRVGFDTQSCASGVEALEVLLDEPDYFDLVITDQNMPKMTGFELIRKIHESNPQLPFILLSGYSQEKLQELVKLHPAIRATLRKPVAKGELLQTIGAALTATSLPSTT